MRLPCVYAKEAARTTCRAVRVGEIRSCVLCLECVYLIRIYYSWIHMLSRIDLRFPGSHSDFLLVCILLCISLSLSRILIVLKLRAQHYMTCCNFALTNRPRPSSLHLSPFRGTYKCDRQRIVLHLHYKRIACPGGNKSNGIFTAKCNEMTSFFYRRRRRCFQVRRVHENDRL